MNDLIACHCCGMIHRAPRLRRGQWARCRRCRARLVGLSRGDTSAARTAAVAFGALALYWPAILLPILEIEKLGHRHQSSILAGVLGLLAQGSWFVGTVIAMFSLVFPLVKIVLLLELSLVGLLHRRLKALTYRTMEHVGRWSMMDVMLLAFMVMLVKLGDLVEFRFGPAVIAFVGCVAMSMLASLLFDPHIIWVEKGVGLQKPNDPKGASRFSRPAPFS